MLLFKLVSCCLRKPGADFLCKCQKDNFFYFLIGMSIRALRQVKNRISIRKKQRVGAIHVKPLLNIVLCKVNSAKVTSCTNLIQVINCTT